MKIEVKDLVKSFEGFRALDGLTLTVPKGAVYGLIGPNGAGKSTLIRHLAGIYRQDAGEVLIGGQPVFENTAVKSRIAYIPDEIFYYTQASIDDMARFYRSVYPSFSRERFERLGEAFPLDRRQSLRKLSKGMQKQAAFWLAASLMPDAVLLDEPMDGLDPVMRRQAWSLLMSDVAERGITVLVSSHNLRELEDVCDHVGMMDKGKMLIERGIDDLQENILKVQLVLPEGGALPEGLEILKQNAAGRVQQLVLRGRADELTAMLEAAKPLLMETMPLTLEEIFIYELGGTGYEIKDILI